MYPPTSDWKRTPSSYDVLSSAAAVCGTALADQREHGQVGPAALVKDQEKSEASAFPAVSLIPPGPPRSVAV